jgi:hypothetical protein
MSALPPHVRDAEITAVATIPMLLPVAVAAQALGCSPRTVRRRIAAGALPAVNEHDRIMVRGDELRDYIERLDRVGAPAPRSRQRAVRDYGFLRD